MNRPTATLALLSALAAAGSASAQTSIWDCGAGHNNHVYRVVSTPNGISWAGAAAAATNAGGYLASLTTAQESAHVFSLVSSGSLWMTFSNGYRGGPWIGGYQQGGATPETGWHWTSGEAWSYTNWDANQPNNAGGINQVFLQFGANTNPANAWNDQANDTSPRVLGYVIEWPGPFTAHPSDVSLCPAGSAAFAVSIREGLPDSLIGFRWQIGTPGGWTDCDDGTLDAVVDGSLRTVASLSGAHTRRLEVHLAGEPSERWGGARFRCVITTACDSVPGNPATLLVCPADANCDGFIDGFDYDAFVTAFETGMPEADFNHDGFADGFDYDDFVAAFEQGC